MRARKVVDTWVASINKAEVFMFITIDFKPNSWAGERFEETRI